MGNCFDEEIRSLTLHFGSVRVNQYDPSEAVELTEDWLDALWKLLLRIKRMGNLESISISADLPLP